MGVVLECMEFFHVMNRAVEGRKLFLDSQDYARFVHDLYEFNDVAPAGDTLRTFNSSNKELDLPNSAVRKKLVNINAWVLMKDHYHLLVSEREPGGVALFMRKMNVGYAKYYNERYARSGYVFHGKTKKVKVSQLAHSLYILHYIHLNPLDYLEGAHEWRIRAKSSIANSQKALAHLSKYRWSSYLDYLGAINFPSILTPVSFTESHTRAYEDEIRDFLASAELSHQPDLVLE